VETQRLPLTITGKLYTDGTKSNVTTSYFLSSPDNRLVMMVDWANNRAQIEEWNASLTAPVDRQPSVTGTQEVVFASYVMAKVFNVKSNAVDFACDLETGDLGDPDWDDDGTNDVAAALSLLGKPRLTTNLTIKSFTGILRGVLNDSQHGATNAPDRSFDGRVKSTGPAF
jgi:hypothetical protein